MNHGGGPGVARAGRWARLRDPVCILLVSAICSAAYVFGLRYYSDDFLFLEPLATSPDQSWWGLYGAIAETPFAAVRPGQILWYVAFHKLAPGNVALIHLANHAAFAASALVMYAALRAVPATRGAAYYVVLLYTCLPTFSVAKMWYANHQAVLSLLMFAMTWLLVTRIATGANPRRWLLVPLVAVTAAIGNAFYELFSITALVLPLFVWWALGRRPRQLARDAAFLAASGAIVAGFVASTLFKLRYDYGVELPGTAPEFALFVRRAAGMYLGAAETTFWTLGLYSPRAAAGILASSYLQPGSVYAPLLVLLVLGAREWLAQRAPATVALEASPLFLAASGIVAFALGYIPYLTNFLYSSKPWGEGNRGNIAAALGAAMLIYAVYRWASSRWPRLASTALIVFCFIGAFLQVAVGKMWVRAAVEQDRVFAQFSRVVRENLPDEGAVLVYGTCPYYGAGPVFPYGWDLRARLVAETGYRDLEVVLVRPAMRPGREGIHMTPTWRGRTLYRYGTFKMLDMRDGSVQPIRGPAEARLYFAAHPPDRAYTCAFDFGIGNPLY